MRTPYERDHMNHIELFAGCGGMSLGFHSEDFNLVMANLIISDGNSRDVFIQFFFSKI